MTNHSLLPFVIFLALGLVVLPLMAASDALAQESGSPPEPRGDLFERSRAIDSEQANAVTIDSRRVLTLQEATERAQAHNPEVLLARERIIQAQSLQDRAWALVLPTASVQAIYTRYDQEQEAEFGAPPLPPVKLTIRPEDEVRLQGSASINLLNGRAIPLVQLGYLAEELQTLSAEQLQVELRYAVAQQYFQLLTLKRLFEIADASVKSAEIVLEAAEGRLAAGAATPFEVTRAKTNLLKTQNELQNHKLAFLKGRQALATFLVTEADFDVAPPALRDLPPESPGELAAAALAERPDVKLGRQQIRAAELEQHDVFWRYAPTVVGQFNVSRSEETAFNPEPWSWNVQLILAWTLYDGGVREADLSETRSKLRTARIELERSEREIDRDLKIALLDVDSFEVQIATSGQEVELASKALEQATDGYRAGALPQIDVIDAELQLRLARTNLERLRLSRALAIENVFRLLGR